MQAAPPIEIRPGDEPAVRAAVGAWAAASLVTWVGAWSQAGGAALLAVCALAGLAGAVVAMRGCRPAVSRLRWDGGQWSVAAAGLADEVTGTVVVAMDLDAWLVLRFDGADGRRRWLTLSRARHPGSWHALRCAVHAGRAEPPLRAGTAV